MPIIKQGDALLTSGNAVASSEACCCTPSSECACSLPYASGVTVTCEFSVTLKAGETNATTGTATQTITLAWNGAEYTGTGTITAVGPANLTAFMACVGENIQFLATVSLCDNNLAYDIFGNALAGCGSSANKVIAGTTVDGRCVPPAGPTVQCPQDDPNFLDPADMGLNFDATFIVTGP